MPELAASSIAAISRIDVVPMLLDLCCRVTGMGFAAIARVTEDRWIACAVKDDIAFGMKPGDELKVETTLCNAVRDRREAIVIDDVASDGIYDAHQTPGTYGFQSYISMPIFRGDGSFFGTLCALDPKPHKVSDPVVTGTFTAFAQFIALHLDAQVRLDASEAALLEERATAALRDRFVAVLGHDLRNPLAAIEAGTRLLSERDPLTPRQAQIVKQMAASNRRMTQLVDHVLDLARGQLGGGLSVDRVDDMTLAESIQLVVAELRAVHPDRTLEARIDIGEPVTCDHQRIMQLVSNLLGNALTYGDPVKPVQIAAETADGCFRVEVANGGRPIPRTRLAKLFEPFTHAGQTKGLGLGLFIAMEIAKAHGGMIDVVSDAAETRFTFAMPCLAQPATD
ncbi:GAF domain-containing sensor histidine kinase [Sphingomonas sp. JC676]|uniref:GAF domain-containing sensor histidine kinase n=1 Tax=Sphingomonas sp. JC676 TaxID=2768065 RepID=UPI0016577E99|nr:GAF domain-containing sensor histidine kinase [Sphingomonas sp. JC676]MBC9032881.1 GAF domain-containing sensor histidine kinase [Sphingomonas sp. JC676]